MTCGVVDAVAGVCCAAMRLAFSFVLTALLWGCAAAAPRQVSAKPPAARAPTRDQPLAIADIVDLRVVGELALSPDGRRVAYVLRTPRSASDKPGGMHRALFVVDTARGEPRQYTREPGSASAPEWSPDGRSIVYVGRREGDARAQLWRIPADGGEAERLTDAPTAVRGFAWLPDGKRIVFTADREPDATDRGDREAGRDWKLGDVDGTPRQLHLLELADHTVRPLTPRDFHVEAMRISPRGDAVAVVGGNRADVDGTMMYGGIFRVEIGAATSQPKAPQKLCETAGKLGDIAWSPAADTLAFLGASDINDPTAGVVYTVPARGGKPTARTLDYLGTAQRVRFVGDDRLLVLANEDTGTALLQLSLGDGKRARIVDGGPICHGIDVTRDGRTLVCAGDTAQHPAELFVRSGRALRRRTHSNPTLDRKRLGEQSVLRWKASDGLAIAGVLTLPVGYRKGQRHPLVVLPHGGPEGVSQAGWNTRAGYPAQLFATRGYVVLEPNYRGSSGRGVAFGKADHGDLGGREFDDVLAGIDELVERGIVDADRVGMGGWSYGGYFSGLAATLHSKRFKAAMVGAAITNWMSFTGTTEIEHENSLVHWKLWPYDDPELVWKRSPMAHTKGSKTATLLVHGLDDSRVPPTQAKELYRALRHAGAKTELVYYPREGHGLAERAHQLDFVQRYLDWFDRALQPSPAE
jgi:dipeptidyl aminopeptidase/acylaminoacyl peptidase